MRIRLLTSISGPAGSYAAGDFLDTTDRNGKRMIAAGRAVAAPATDTSGADCSAATAPDLLTTTAAEARETTSAAPKRARRTRKG